MDVGLTLVDPFADVDVNVPGVITRLVAPVVVQLNVLLAPEFMPVGSAAKELIVGIDCEVFPPEEGDDPQARRPAQASRTAASTALFRGNGFRPRSEELPAALQFGELIPSLYCRHRRHSSSLWL